MKFILSDEVQVESLRQARQHDHADDMADNKYSRTSTRTWSTRPRPSPIAQTPYTLKFFELINSPQGPWLQMLQRVYYTDDPIDSDHRRRQGSR